MVRLIGAHEHTLDAKGRLVVPAALRGPLLEAGGYLTKEKDGCLGLLTPPAFEAQAEQWAAEAAIGERRDRHALRSFIARAHPVEVDRHGRIAIPRKLREFAALDTDCVVLGILDRIEIWAAERFTQIEARGDAVLSDPDADDDADWANGEWRP